MKTVQDLYQEMTSHRDVTVALTIKDAIDNLLRREALYRLTPLGDNILDLIAEELPNTVGEEGLTSMMTVVNMLAPSSARAGSVNPVKAGSQLLNSRKTGQQVIIQAPSLETDFNPPFGLVAQNSKGIQVVFISSYKTNEFTISGGLIPEILVSTKRYPVGVLTYQSPDEVLPEGAFHTCCEQAFNEVSKKLNITNPKDNPTSAISLLQQAAASLKSNEPRFIVKNANACSPRPNFMKSEEWPKIVTIIEDWLNKNN